MFAAVAVFGLSTIVFALSNYVHRRARSALAVLGASDMVSVVIRMTLVQLGTPDDVRGRVTAVNGLFVGASNQLGEFRAGAMASWIGAVPAVLVGGIGTLVIALLWTRLFPELWRADRLDAARADYSAAASCCGCAPCASQWSRKSASHARMPWS